MLPLFHNVFLADKIFKKTIKRIETMIKAFTIFLLSSFMPPFVDSTNKLVKKRTVMVIMDRCVPIKKTWYVRSTKTLSSTIRKNTLGIRFLQKTPMKVEK